MELYVSKPDETLRICITQQGSKAEYFTVWKCTVKEAQDHFMKAIEKSKPSIFADGKKTNVQIREAVGGVNGKVTSFAFKGFSPQETKEILIKSIK